MTPIRRRQFIGVDLAGAAMLLTIAGLVGILGLQPISELRHAQTVRTARLGSIQAQADVVLEEIRSLQHSLAEIATQTEQRQHRLMSSRDLNARIAEIIRRTDDNRLDMIAIEPGELSVGEMYGRTPIEIAVQGVLPDVVRYLHQMRRESADLVVRRLELRAGPEGGVLAQIRTDWLTHAD